MHIPDGFLDLKTSLICGAISTAGIGLAVKNYRMNSHPRMIPIMGVGAAFIFAAQMVNFPIIGATSGHLVGGALAAVLFGPTSAILMMTAVLVVQCLLFADGGITALGANLFNMALVSPLIGYFVFTGIIRFWPSDIGKTISLFLGAWLGTLSAAISCAGQLAFSGTGLWTPLLLAMAGIHAIIGIGEAFISVLIFNAVVKFRPELAIHSVEKSASLKTGMALSLVFVVALGFAIFVSPFACSCPDGLEKIAQTMNFEGKALKGAIFTQLFKDYQIHGFESHSISLAGGIGTTVTLIFACFFSWLFLAKTPSSPKTSEKLPIDLS
ncbi:MAG: energy-coupling factor ABC transporter permease [Candidatus Riflebacteria bacterium]|nr:energy-coupling factor ABC transporter permease [Candidatus Riflebacteria bacterium]